MPKVSNNAKISRKASMKESCDFHSRVEQVVRFLEDEDDDDG
jgi:hypothetical protein